MDGIRYAMDLEVPASYNKRDDETPYTPSQDELERRKRITDEWDAKEREKRELVEKAHAEAIQERDKRQLNADVEEYMRYYPVSREVATANIGWFRSEGRSKIMNQMRDYSQNIF